jgi:hypothetical protein
VQSAIRVTQGKRSNQGLSRLVKGCPRHGTHFFLYRRVIELCARQHQAVLDVLGNKCTFDGGKDAREGQIWRTWREKRVAMLDLFRYCCAGCTFGPRRGDGTMVEEEKHLLVEVVHQLAAMGQV